MYGLWRSSFRGPLALALVTVYVLIFFVTPAVAASNVEPAAIADVATQQDTEETESETSGAVDECWQGRADGERDAKGNPLWFVAGLACGIFGFGAAYLIEPSPPASALLGKSSGYALCYTEAYQDKSKGKNAMYAGIGWLVWIVIYLGLILPGVD